MFTIARVGDGAEAAVPVLAGYLSGTGADDVGGGCAAQALARIGAKAVPALITPLRHPDARVRQRAASALGEMAPGVAAAAREALQAATRDADPAVAAAGGPPGAGASGGRHEPPRRRRPRNQKRAARAGRRNAMNNNPHRVFAKCHGPQVGDPAKPFVPPGVVKP